MPPLSARARYPFARPARLLTALAAAGLGAPLAGQTADPANDRQPAEAVRRVVHVFDFEEQDAPTPWPHDVPRHWLRAQDSEGRPRPGYPAFNLARFDRTVAAAGRASLIVPTQGGSTTVRLAPGVIPIFPQGDYTITGQVRTDGLAHARAFVTARFLDQRLAPIAGAQTRTAPIGTAGAWLSFTLDLAGLFDDAAFLQIDLELLQPREFGAPPELGEHNVWPEDFSGAAWFDDVAVSQLPRVELSTASPANIVIEPDRPLLRPVIRDLVGEWLDGHLVVRDLDGSIADQSSFSVSGGPIGKGGCEPWAPTLPRFGWYRATLDVYSAERRVGHTEVAFLFLSEESASGPGQSERHRFGMIGDRATRDELAHLATVVRESGSGFVVLPVWDDDVTRATLSRSIGARERVLDELLAMRQSVTFAIPSIPAEIATQLRLDRDDPLALATVDPALWLGYLTPVLDHYGQRITRWQIGRLGDDRSSWRRGGGGTAEGEGEGGGGVSSSLWRFHDLLEGLVPGPVVAIPWWADRRLPAVTAQPLLEGIKGSRDQGIKGKTLTLDPSSLDPSSLPLRSMIAVPVIYPESFASSSLGALAAQWRRDTGPRAGSAPLELTFVPELASEELFGSRARVVELATRCIEFWGAMAEPIAGQPAAKLAIDHPWRWSEDRRPRMEPTPELGAWRTLVKRLSGRRIVGPYPAPPGVRCYIVASAEDSSNPRALGALIAWNESAPPPLAVIHAYLGEGNVTLADIFGNERALERNRDASGTHTIELTETPSFIEGVDPFLARFMASVRMEPSFAPAVAAQHEHAIVISNPWPVPISGRLRVLPPDMTGDRPAGGGGRTGWTITPSGTIGFTLEPGQSRAVPFAFTFPPAEEAGLKGLTAVIDLDTDQGYPPLSIRAVVELGMKDFDMIADCRLSPGPDGPDVIVTAVITNKGQVHRTLHLDAAALATPAQQVPISDLAPGQSVLKRIVLHGAAARLTGKRVRLSLGDADAPERLNKSVRVP